ncbi:MAG: serine/threonine phosphatase, partial [Cyanobacteria bacterium J06623_7]
ICCQCGLEIPIEAKVCDNCGAANHTVLWAIISQTKTTTSLGTSPELASIGSITGESPELEIASLADLFAPNNLQTSPSLQLQTASGEAAQNRYAMKQEPSYQPSPQLEGVSRDSFLQGQVIDLYPLQKSHLATLQKQQMDLFAELSQDLNDSYLAVTEYWNLIGLPTHALPYLILERYTPTVPKIYDAWQQSDRGVVLLPDRSDWQLVTEVWSQRQLPLSQIIWFLDEMAKLWEPLQRIGCAQSLLVRENLLLDEDEAFCLRQLYMDADYKPTLRDLAQTWQFCLAESHLEQISNLNLLLDQMISGEIVEIEQLRLELHNLGLDEAEITAVEGDTILPLDSFNSAAHNPESSFIIQSESTMPHQDRVPLVKVNSPESTAPSEFEAISAEPEVFFDEIDDEDMMYSSEFEEQATAMIPMQLRDLKDACCTDIGAQRDHNEDFFGVQTAYEKTENNTENNLSVHGLYIVCDGMGGHAAGEVASAMAVESLQKYFQTHWQEEFPDRQTIEAAVLQANETLYQINIDNARSGNGRMGTTLVMALVRDTQMAIAHVGDSRIYRFSHKQGLEQLTLDHEVGQREINRGVEPDIAYGRPDAYQLTQALGPRDNSCVRPDVQFLEINEDCLILLCSDGFSDNDFIEENYSEHLKPLLSSDANLQKGLFELVNLANQHNGHDNITAVLLRVKLKPDF